MAVVCRLSDPLKVFFYRLIVASVGDFFDWFYLKPQRSRLLGLSIALYGLLLKATVNLTRQRLF